MSPTAIFRADAGPGMGGGHVQRCLALAETMVQQKWRCCFAVRGATEETVPALGASGHRLLRLAGPDRDEVAEMAASLREKCDLLVLDHYDRDSAFEAACRGFALRIMAIEDRPSRPHDCDFVLDPTPGRSGVDYETLLPSHCRMLLGPDYALLRRQFAEARPAALTRRESGQPVSRLLVSIGMTDPQNITGRVLKGVAESGPALAVDVVLGSVAPHLAAVQEAAASMGAEVHVDVTDMADFMSRADLAISASGSTVLERCCLGLPGIAIVTAENQRHLADAFRAANIAEVIDADQATPQWIADTQRRLCTDAEARTAMSRAAAALCDGQGPARVIEALK